MSSEPLNLLALNEEIRDFLADDMVQKLRVPWTESNIVRIGVVNGNDSLIHSVIKSFYKEYNDNNEKTFRESIARDLRVDLAALLDVLVDDNSNMSMYDIINDSIYKILGEKGIKITNKFGTKTGFTKEDMKDNLLSNEPVYDSYFTYVSSMLGVDIYFVTVTDDDIIYLYDTSDEKRGFYPTIVLNTDGINFEVIGISHDLKSIDDHKIQTIFDFDDKFIIDMKQHSKELAKDSLKLLF